MPTMVTAPDALAEYQRDLARALKLLGEKAPDYELGKSFYEGSRHEVSSSKLIRSMIEANAEAQPISLAHIPVDVLSDKIDLTGLTAKDARANALLELVADANDLDDEADDWVKKACYFGDYYVIVDPQIEELDGNIDPASIRWVGSSPLTTIVIYDRKDGRTPLYGVKRWKGEGDRWHALIYYDDGTVKLVTNQGMTATTMAEAQHYRPDIEPDGEPGDELIAHDGGRMLIAHLAVDGKPYGKPVHTKAYGPQDAITKISATNLNNVDGQGFAARWALADPLAEIDDDMDSDFGTDGPGEPAGTADSQTTATTGASRIRTVPGAIAILKGIKAVGQFDTTGSEDFLKNLDWYVRVMALACGVAMFEFDLKGDQPSGESRRRAEGRSIKHARKIQRAAGAFVRAIGDTTLALLGMTSEVTVSFNPLETSTDKDGLELVALKITAGVPVTVALIEAGYTSEQVAEWYRDGSPHVTPGLLTTLASALSSLGQAKTLGVITDNELRDMLPTILTGARGEGPAVDDGPDVMDGIVTNAAEEVKAKADAVGALVRAGADPEQAANLVGLDGLLFPNVPTTVRVPEEDATTLEGSAPVAPVAPAAPTVPAAPEPPVVE